MTDKELDILEWGIRQLMNHKVISKRQMFLVFRVLLYSEGRKKRFSDKEIKKLLEYVKND